jgi:hypothetical protein
MSIMSSRFTVTQRSPALRKKPAANVIAAVRPAVRDDAAANGDVQTSEFSIFGDPLWGIAIAAGVLFAVLAALIAVG